MLVDVFAQAVALRRGKHSVIAVDGGQHALEQSGAWVTGLEQRGVELQPALPTTAGGQLAAVLRVSKYQRFKPAQALPERAYDALANKAVLREDDVAQKVYALVAALQDGFAGVQLKPEPLLQEAAYFCLPALEGGRVISEEDEVVYIAQVAARLKGVLDKLVEFVEVDVGKKLASKAADGHAHTRACCKKRFVWRNKRQQGYVATGPRGWMRGWLADDCSCHMVKQPPHLGVARQTGHGLTPKLQQDGTVNTWEKRTNVHVAVPTMASLAHEVLQAVDCCECALALAVGVAVVNEPFVPPGLDVADEPLLHQTVCEIGGKDFTEFGISYRKYSEGARRVLALVNLMRQRKHKLRQAREVGAFVFAVACPGGTFEQLPSNVSFSHGALWNVLSNTLRFLRIC